MVDPILQCSIRAVLSGQGFDRSIHETGERPSFVPTSSTQKQARQGAVASGALGTVPCVSLEVLHKGGERGGGEKKDV